MNQFPYCQRDQIVVAKKPHARSGTWLLTGMLYFVMPKCPACFAAWFTFVTGLGMSLAVASYLRLMLITVCLGAFAVVAFRLLASTRRSRGSDAARLMSQKLNIL